MSHEWSDASRPKFFGRRRGRSLNPTQQRILVDKLPGLSVDPDALPADPSDLFDVEIRDLWLEVGFGSGEHLVGQAGNHADIGFLGCEPFINGVAKMVRDADAAGLRNVKILADDARLLLDALPDACLGRAYVLFPDPWPKKRHRPRRFVGPDNLPRLARLLRPGAELRCATDHPDYLDWMLYHVGRSAAFEWLAEGPKDWRDRWDDHIPTRYETKALAGRPSYLRFRRV